jgi:hypothetical protein
MVLRKVDENRTREMTCEKSSALDGCQHADRMSSRLERDFRKRKNESGRDAYATFDVSHDSKHFCRGLNYSVTDGAASKWHLTTRMVRSSLKASPQKSAAPL